MQNDEDVENKYVKFYCATTQYSESQFCGPHNRPHGVRRLIHQYHMSFYPKLGHWTCSICIITCAYTQCKPTIYKLWTPGMPARQQPHYQPDNYYTYWTVLVSFNNWDFIQLSHKGKSSEDIDKINQVVLYVISDNMAALVWTGQHGSINKTDTNTMGYYVIKLLS